MDSLWIKLLEHGFKVDDELELIVHALHLHKVFELKVFTIDIHILDTCLELFGLRIEMLRFVLKSQFLDTEYGAFGLIIVLTASLCLFETIY